MSTHAPDENTPKNGVSFREWTPQEYREAMERASAAFAAEDLGDPSPDQCVPFEQVLAEMEAIVEERI